MITLIIFSKNRPLQLDLCLSSIRQNFQANCMPIVLYDCDSEYENAYNTLKQEHLGVMFWRQGRSLFEDIFVALKAYDTPYCCFMTDDCIMYRKSPSLSDGNLQKLFEMSNVCCFSLRLGLNTNKRGHKHIDGEYFLVDDPLEYTKGLDILKNSKGLILWNRTQHHYGGYWNYPLSVDGNIFRTKDLCNYAEELFYLEKIKNWQQTPNEFERALQRFVNEAEMVVACFEYSCVVNSPNNKVQNTINNYSGVFYPAEAKMLLDLFENGKRINLNKLNINEVNCPHTEINILEGLQ